MVPLKDNLPTDRVPLVTLLLIAANVVAYVLTDDGRLLQLIANAAGLWLFGISVEDSMARWRYLVLCALGGGAAVALHAALDSGADLLWPAASGIAATAVAAHLALYAHAKIVSLGFLVLFVGLYEVPAWLLAGVWAVAQIALSLTGPGDGLAAFAWVGGAVVGAAGVRLLAQKRKVPATLPERSRDPRATAAVGS